MENELIEVEITVSKKNKFKLLVDEYTASNLQACIDNWSMRTNKYTQQSLADYINSKDYAGCKAKIIKS
jgi:hypothetical protein